MRTKDKKYVDKATEKKIRNCKEPMFAGRDRDNIYVDNYFFYIDDNFYMASSNCYGSQWCPNISYYEIRVDYFEKEFEKFKEEYKDSNDDKIKYQILNTTIFLNQNKEKFELRKLEDKKADIKKKIDILENRIKDLENLVKEAPNTLSNYRTELAEFKTILEEIENKKNVKSLKKRKK